MIITLFTRWHHIIVRQPLISRALDLERSVSRAENGAERTKKSDERSGAVSRSRKKTSGAEGRGAVAER